MWTNDHGADGLRGKFAVYKQADRQTAACSPAQYGWYAGDYFAPDRRIGEDGEFVFVLRPHSDEAAWAALLRYAELVRYRAPQLAADIEERLRAIYVHHGNGGACGCQAGPGPLCRCGARNLETWVPDSDCRRGGA